MSELQLLPLIAALALLVGVYARIVYWAAGRSLGPAVAWLWRVLAAAEQAMDDDADRRAAAIRARLGR